MPDSALLGQSGLSGLPEHADLVPHCPRAIGPGDPQIRGKQTGPEPPHARTGLGDTIPRWHLGSGNPGPLRVGKDNNIRGGVSRLSELVVTTVSSEDFSMPDPRTRGAKPWAPSQLAERRVRVLSNPVTFPQPREKFLWSSCARGELTEPRSHVEVA